MNVEVQQALQAKREKLETIQGEAEIAVKKFKEDLDKQLKTTID